MIPNPNVYLLHLATQLRQPETGYGQSAHALSTGQVHYVITP